MFKLFGLITTMFVVILIVTGPGTLAIHYVCESIRSTDVGGTAETLPFLLMIEQVFIITSAISIIGIIIAMFVWAFMRKSRYEGEYYG
jgi:hypothetical protein